MISGGASIKLFAFHTDLNTFAEGTSVQQPALTDQHTLDFTCLRSKSDL